MKKVVQTIEVEGEGLQSLLDEQVVVWCLNYIYSGKLVGVNDDCILLEDASVVYETGPLGAKDFTAAEKLPKPCYVMTRCIESFMAR